MSREKYLEEKVVMLESKCRTYHAEVKYEQTRANEFGFSLTLALEKLRDAGIAYGGGYDVNDES